MYSFYLRNTHKPDAALPRTQNKIIVDKLE